MTSSFPKEADQLCKLYYHTIHLRLTQKSDHTQQLKGHTAH